MSEAPKTRAAQYLRMSTEHQRYSLANQAEVIAAYAAAYGYEVVRSYVDPARSGLTLDGRPGLQGLLADVFTAPREFAAVLVLDVSRWGRFQDHDEAAHYEFVCRSAGVPVIYCAEPFENDSSAVSSLLKMLKRLMAAEFSRDLSAKVKQAQMHSAMLGRHPRGRAVYGVRRVALDAEGTVRQILGPRERKMYAEDRVVLRPGPDDELRIIRRTFRQFVLQDRGICALMADLNREQVRSPTGRAWTRDLVADLLRNELMIGVKVSNRSSQPLHGPRVWTPADAWIRTRLFAPIVPPKLFRAAQAKFADGRRLSHEGMLRALRRVWRRHGRLSAALIDAAAGAPSSSSYARCFGSLRKAYAAVGYALPGSPEHQAQVRPRLIAELRDAYNRHGYLSERIVEADPRLRHPNTYRLMFGSLLRAYEIAGLLCEREALVDAARARWAARRAAGKACGRAKLDDDEVLAALRRLHAKHGYVSANLLRADPRAPQPQLLRYRFGSLAAAYARAGLPHAWKALQLAGVHRRRPKRPAWAEQART